MKIRKVLLVVAVAVGLVSIMASSPILRALPAQDADEISYTMPPGWVVQAVQGGPEIKAHYVFMNGGRPYGEMYLSQVVLAAPQTADLVFQEGLAKVRPTMPYYQARNTQKVVLGGIDTVVHEFAYMPQGAGVMFIGRSYTMVVGSTAFTFFFQAVTNFFPSMQTQFSQVMTTVRPIPKPAPTPRVDAGGNLPAANVTALTGPKTVEDMGLNFEFPGGWAASGDAQGAKYRLYGPNGVLLSSMFIQRIDETMGVATLLGGTPESALYGGLEDKINQEFKAYERYAPVATVKRKIAGFSGVVHDFTFNLNGRPVLYRWCAIVIPKKSDAPNIIVAPDVQPFAFMTAVMDKAEEFKQNWDAIIDSMRPMGTAAPGWTRPAAKTEANRTTAAPRPRDEGGLPALVEENPETGLYADPFGRYSIKLPETAVHVKTEDNAATFRLPSPNTIFIIHSFRQNETGDRLAGRFTQGKKLNGTETKIPVGARAAAVGLYTAKDETGENMAWVIAHYQGAGLLIVVTLPAREYAKSQSWISALLRSVRFRD